MKRLVIRITKPEAPMPIIPVFFACDDNYAPFLSVAINSLLENADKRYFYRIHILTSGFCPLYKNRLISSKTENSEIIFVDPTPKLKHIADKLHLRDYYSITTYYRLFIAEMFPKYNKVLYLDADIVIPGDVSKLYNTELGEMLLGAVQEDVMNGVEVFGAYAEAVLGVNRADYFNAGVLVMNLKRFRECGIEEKFIALLGKCKFEVTQDQDYLNVLCKDSVVNLGYEWNKSPSDDVSGFVPCPELIHFKLNWKPWHYSGIQYEDLFWKYVAKSEFASEITAIKNDFSIADALKDKASYNRLMKLAADKISEANALRMEFAAV